jgi:hypothetical protein
LVMGTDWVCLQGGSHNHLIYSQYSVYGLYIQNRQNLEIGHPTSEIVIDAMSDVDGPIYLGDILLDTLDITRAM